MPLPESELSQFIHAIIKIVGNHFVYVTVFNIDIPYLTDLDSQFGGQL